MRIEDRILFIDAHAIVLDKPAGMPVDESRDGALAIANHLDLLRFGFQRLPQPVHRLDRDTSGCLLLARNPKAHRQLASAFEEGRVAKTYLAVLAGVPAAVYGTVDLPLAKRTSAVGGWRVVSDPRGKPAVTDWELVAAAEGRALVRFRPRTGRTHQIRVHAAEGLGLPIAGDPVYGDGRGPMLLHAQALTVPRQSKPPISATASPPESFGGFRELVETEGREGADARA